MPLEQRHRLHWRSNLALTAALLLLWAAAGFGIAWFARTLTFGFFGWPFSFWVAAQGALIVFLLIVAFYATFMNRLDRRHGVAEDH